MAPDAVHALSTQLQSTLFACARGGASGAGGDAARGDVPLWRLATEAEACSELRARNLCRAWQAAVKALCEYAHLKG
jgi:hypothetical protein